MLVFYRRYKLFLWRRGIQHWVPRIAKIHLHNAHVKVASRSSGGSNYNIFGMNKIIYLDADSLSANEIFI